MMITKPRILIIAFCAFIVLATTAAFRWDFLSYSHDEQRSVQLILIFAIGVFCLFENVSRHIAAWRILAILPKPAMVALLLFFVIGLISAFMARLPAWALLEWGHWFLLVAACLALALAFSAEARTEDYLFAALALAAAFYALQVAIQYFVSIAVTHKLD